MGPALERELNRRFPHGFRIMSRINIKQYYSTRRKRDVVTGAAILFFGALIVFQIYITIVFPIQLKRQRFLIAEIEKDEMYEQIDRIRDLVRHTRGRDYAESGEIKLVEGVMDQFALHVREHGKEMTPEQVSDLRNVLSRYESIAIAWQKEIKLTPEQISTLQSTLSDYDPKITTEKKDPKYHIVQDGLDASSYARTIETNILNTP